MLNHILGQYIAIGWATPDKYPKSPMLSETDTKQAQSPEAFRQLMRQRYGKK